MLSWRCVGVFRALIPLGEPIDADILRLLVVLGSNTASFCAVLMSRCFVGSVRFGGPDPTHLLGFGLFFD